MGSVAGYTPGMEGSEEGDGKGSYDPDAVALPVVVGSAVPVPLPEPEKAGLVVATEVVATAEDVVPMTDVA